MCRTAVRSVFRSTRQEKRRIRLGKTRRKIATHAAQRRAQLAAVVPCLRARANGPPRLSALPHSRGKIGAPYDESRKAQKKKCVERRVGMRVPPCPVALRRTLPPFPRPLPLAASLFSTHSLSLFSLLPAPRRFRFLSTRPLLHVAPLALVRCNGPCSSLSFPSLAFSFSRSLTHSLARSLTRSALVLHGRRLFRPKDSKRIRTRENGGRRRQVLQGHPRRVQHPLLRTDGTPHASPHAHPPTCPHTHTHPHLLILVLRARTRFSSAASRSSSSARSL